MERLTNWKARRSGGRITLNGVDDTGADVRFANIDTIVSAKPHPIATDKDGESYQLA